MRKFAGFEEWVKNEVKLAPYTWFGLGGTAEIFAQPESVQQLQGLVRRCRECGRSIKVLGDGSNLLIRDGNISDVVLRLTEPVFSELQIEGTRIQAGAGLTLGRVVARTASCGLAGLEDLTSIPGTVGAAVAGNSGGRFGDISQFLSQILVMDRQGEISIIRRQDIPFSYRSSGLKEFIILNTWFELQRGDPAVIQEEIHRINLAKRYSQPLNARSSGCVFKNHRGISSGALIQRAGLMGERVGGARVSERHANFIVAEEGATSEDVLTLMARVQAEVALRFRVWLEPEIDVW